MSVLNFRAFAVAAAAGAAVVGSQPAEAATLRITWSGLIDAGTNSPGYYQQALLDAPATLRGLGFQISFDYDLDRPSVFLGDYTLAGNGAAPLPGAITRAAVLVGHASYALVAQQNRLGNFPSAAAATGLSFTADRMVSLDGHTGRAEIHAAADLGMPFDITVPGTYLLDPFNNDSGDGAEASFSYYVSDEGCYRCTNFSGIPTRIEVRAVPEPTTWTLLILGFGLAGGGLRRRAAKSA